MKKAELELYSWIVRGSQRTIILAALIKPMTPKQLSIKTKLKFSNVSDVLREMTEKGIVECLNPDEKTGRLYAVTKQGAQLQQEF